MDTTKQLPPPASASTSPRPWHGTFLAGVAEILDRIAETCLQPVIVLPLFFAAANTSAVGVGRALAIVLGVGAIAGALVTPLAGERWPRARLIALIAATGLASFLLLGLARAGGWLAGQRDELTGKPLLILALIGGGLGVGATLRPALARITRPDGSWRTRWGRWLLLGSVGTVLGGLVARGPAAQLVAPFPAGFTALFATAGAALLVALVVLVGSLALGWRGPTGGIPVRTDLLAIPELLANNLAYDRFVFFRALYACGALADPFYIIYAVRELGATGRNIALYIVALVIARAVGAFIWRGLSIGAGNPIVLQLTTFFRLLAPITALTLPPLLGSVALRDRLPGGDATSLYAFGLVFVAWGMASVGIDLAAPAIQTALTTPRERIAAQTVTGLVLALAMLALPLGGLIVDRLGFSFLFIGALLVGMGTLLAGGLIDESGVLVLRAAPNERPLLRRRSARREG
jgi:hypothetical protein